MTDTVNDMRKLLIATALILAVALAHRLMTFPVLGYHPPACLCETCFDQFAAEYELDRLEGEQK